MSGGTETHNGPDGETGFTLTFDKPDGDDEFRSSVRRNQEKEGNSGAAPKTE